MLHLPDYLDLLSGGAWLLPGSCLIINHHCTVRGPYPGTHVKCKLLLLDQGYSWRLQFECCYKSQTFYYVKHQEIALLLNQYQYSLLFGVWFPFLGESGSQNTAIEWYAPQLSSFILLPISDISPKADAESHLLLAHIQQVTPDRERYVWREKMINWAELTVIDAIFSASSVWMSSLWECDTQSLDCWSSHCYH